MPNKVFRQKRQSDGKCQILMHGRAIESNPKILQVGQNLGSFEITIKRSVRNRDDAFETTTDRQSQQQNIVRHVNCHNSQMVTTVFIHQKSTRYRVL